MSDEFVNESGLVPVGFSSLQRISNSLRITNKLIQSGKIESVVIGTQEWMLRNLDVSTFRNGDSIAEIRDHREWDEAGKEGVPAWCYYDNQSENGEKCGKLYNWHAINDKRCLAPTGWRVPSYKDFSDLVVTLGGTQVAGRKLKIREQHPLAKRVDELPQSIFESDEDLELFRLFDESLQSLIDDKFKTLFGIEYKGSQDFRSGTNESKFSAQLVGVRYGIHAEIVGCFNKMDQVAAFWLRDSKISGDVNCIMLSCASDSVSFFSVGAHWGFTVRCIKG